jgi:hypothetical protein
LRESWTRPGAIALHDWGRGVSHKAPPLSSLISFFITA